MLVLVLNHLSVMTLSTSYSNPSDLNQKRKNNLSNNIKTSSMMNLT
jgi:uncharacterized membrane protein YukC